MRVCVVPLAAVLVAAAASAQAAGCPPPAVQVAFSVAQEPLSYGNSKSISELNALSGTAPAEGRTMGLTQMKAGYGVRVTLDLQSTPNGLFCPKNAAVAVTLQAKERRVWIGREIAPGGCGYNEVLTHEQKHVAVDDIMLVEAARYMPALLQRDLARLPVLGPDAEDSLKRAFFQNVQNTVAVHLNAYDQERARRQAAIDSPQEYQRLAGVCRGELRRVRS